MTKYEWESELKRNVHRLPDEEIKRVLEYYDELFADKIKQGKTETEIIATFGNPVDVADKILSEYEGELKEDDTVPPPEAEISKRRCVQQAEREMSEIPLAQEDAPASVHPTAANANTAKNEGFHGDRLALFIVLNILTGFTFFIVTGALWIVIGSLLIAGGAIAVSSVAAVVLSFIPLFGGSVGSFVAQLGMSIALAGVGIVLSVGMVQVTKLAAKATASVYKAIGRWISGKKEVQYA